jgi:hypothetical protein
VILTAIIVFPPIAIVYMESYYAGSMIHVTFIWVLMIINMGVFIECKYGFETGIAAFISYRRAVNWNEFLSSRKNTLLSPLYFGKGYIGSIVYIHLPPYLCFIMELPFL